jgi:hypothetical protein
VINLVSYFEIGGKIIEVATHQEDANNYQEFMRPMDELGNMIIEKAAVTALDAVVGDEYDVKRAAAGGHKMRFGTTSVGTGIKIARWAMVAAAADGPLPVGDVIAAGILIGGGAYMIHQGFQDIRQ